MTNKRFVVEIVEDKKKLLLLYSKKSKVSEYVKHRLIDAYEVYESTDFSSEAIMHEGYDLVVCLGVFPKYKELLRKNRLSIFFFFYDPEAYRTHEKWCLKNLKNYKIVNIGKTDRRPHELIDFVLFKTPVPYSFNYSQAVKPQLFHQSEIKSKTVFFLTLKIAVSFLIFSNFLFFSSFIYEWYGMWQLWGKRNKNLDIISKQFTK